MYITCISDRSVLTGYNLAIMDNFRIKYGFEIGNLHFVNKNAILGISVPIFPIHCNIYFKVYISNLLLILFLSQKLTIKIILEIDSNIQLWFK